MTAAALQAEGRTLRADRQRLETLPREIPRPAGEKRGASGWRLRKERMRKGRATIQAAPL